MRAPAVIGLDVGGVSTKAATVDAGAVRTAARAFEVWRDLPALGATIASVLDELDPAGAAGVALTMTAELSDAFASKPEGVAFVLDAVAGTGRPARVFTVDGDFLAPGDARREPRRVAAANWAATAALVARELTAALVADVGSTTTDVIPVHRGRVAARGRTDLERLLHDELRYTGALRTNAAAIAPTVPLRGRECPVASELFAVSADVHVLLGHLRPEQCTARLPDGRSASPRDARARLSRLVCADPDELTADELLAIAARLHERQVADIAAAMRAVAGRFADPPAVVALGSGSFLARAAAELAGLAAAPAPAVLRGPGGAIAPAVALAILGAP